MENNKYISFYTVKVRKKNHKNTYNETYIINPLIENTLADRLGQLAIFWAELGKNYQKAEKYFLKAIENDPKNPFWLGNYAVFLHYYRKKYQKAEYFYKESLKYDDNDSFLLINYAYLAVNILQNEAKADELFKKAIKADTLNADAYGSYALFLYKIKRNYKLAHAHAFWAYKLDKQNPYWLLLLVQLKIFTNNFNVAEKLLEKFFLLNNIENNLQIEAWFLRYAYFPQWLDTAKTKILELNNNNEIAIIDIEENLKRAKDTHPDPQELYQLSILIAKNDKYEQNLNKL